MPNRPFVRKTGSDRRLRAVSATLKRFRQLMDLSCEQTIAARASPPGSGRHAIVRVSGPTCRQVVGHVFTADDAPRFDRTGYPARHTGSIILSRLRSPLPCSAWFWPTVRSYTGQPLCELHLPGADPLVEAVLEELFAGGARPASAGEFTLRAFLGQRIDLLQAEAVLGVIDAPDEFHLSTSLRQLAGGLSNALGGLHEQLLIDLADLEAGLDFVEEDIDFVDRGRIRERLAAVRSMLHGLQQQSAHRMHAVPVNRVVLAGLPNSGKSTLFNTLLNRDSALVSSRSGTTRDSLRGRINWEGRDIELVDTPGYENEDDELDAVMRSAFALRDGAMDRAWIVVWCRATDLDQKGRERDDRERARVAERATQLIPVTTKSDLAVGGADSSGMSVSAVSGAGIAELRRALLVALHRDRALSHELIGSTAARCADSIRRAGEAVSRAARLVEERAGDELVAAELRAAVDEIGRMTGRIHSEEILDRIFSRFCIGK